MKRLLFASVLALAGCSASQTASVDKAVSSAVNTPAGQLFCAVDSVAGPLVVAAVAPTGAPLIATGAAQAVVQTECANAQVAGAAGTPVPVSPPASPDSAPRVVSITLNVAAPAPVPAVAPVTPPAPVVTPAVTPAAPASVTPDKAP